MSTKKTPPTQPKQLVQTPPSVISSALDEATFTVDDVNSNTEIIEENVYIPSEKQKDVKLDFDHVDEVKVSKTKKKIEYKIVSYRNDYVRLQEEVNKLINEGWDLVGGLSTSLSVGQYESVSVFSQALIKK
jgi:transcription elongation GreA/GreB family factor